jgi:hypothetical protein
VLDRLEPCNFLLSKFTLGKINEEKLDINKEEEIIQDKGLVAV